MAKTKTKGKKIQDPNAELKTMIQELEELKRELEELEKEINDDIISCKPLFE